MSRLVVFGATGAIGGRFVEIIGGDQRAELRVVLRRVTRTARVARFPVELRCAVGRSEVATAMHGCCAAISFIDGPEADGALASVLIAACVDAGMNRFVHLGRLAPLHTGGDGARRRSFEDALLREGDAAGVPVTVVTAPLVYGPFTIDGAQCPAERARRGRVAVARRSGRCNLIYVDDVVEAMWTAATVATPVHGRVRVSGPESTTWKGFHESFHWVVGRPTVASMSATRLDAFSTAAAGGAADTRWPDVSVWRRRVLRAFARRVLRRRVRQPRWLVLPDPEELTLRAWHADVSLTEAERLLGWRPKVGLAEGMRRTEAYLRWANPWLQPDADRAETPAGRRDGSRRRP